MDSREHQRQLKELQGRLDQASQLACRLKLQERGRLYDYRRYVIDRIEKDIDKLQKGR